MKELKDQKPGHLVLVPLYLETFYRKIWANIKDQGKETLVNTMIKLYKIDSQIADLGELRADKSADKDKGLQSNRDEMQAEIDALNVKIDALEAEKSSMMSSISGTEADTRIQSKLND